MGTGLTLTVSGVQQLTRAHIQITRADIENTRADIQLTRADIRVDLSHHSVRSSTGLSL